MKKIFLILGIAATTAFVSCKNNDASSKIKSENVEVAAQRDEAAKNVAEMTFEFTEYDFGSIEQGTQVEKVFKFTNTGNAPLIITNATSSCGCTIPQYPRNTPIAPGESGELLVKYNGSGKNQVTKTVTVTANTAKGSELIRIKAFVNGKDNISPITSQTK
ncbi:DUF1573 domain-containing protein [Leptobacterium flavescens]|uniref:DUF1573 domain-containing protein n=1 Tax=Leptobacterium flavescens TaxID=472055 RepID=A0A6P0UG61_9FLAO|nr:DUF1573 domain-containing protein [Leptobacterium flavescens]NER12234.1 DUF1573 domain-containing protein [Leptobacterium flavescens]